MDLSETRGIVMNRHPWELSRTRCVLDAIDPYMIKMHQNNKGLQYINVGAGDLYFDRLLLKRYPHESVHAIDIAYPKTGKKKRIAKYHYLEEAGLMADYAFMMDSLEYMEDDIGYLKKLVDKMADHSYLFLTLPAFTKLFSDYDVKIKNLRRYDRKTAIKLIRRIPELKIIECSYFYTSLFMVRFFQKILHLPIDPNQNFTAHWMHKETGFLTRVLTGCLNLDFKFNRLISRIGLRLPGLSMLLVCKVNR